MISLFSTLSADSSRLFELHCNLSLRSPICMISFSCAFFLPIPQVRLFTRAFSIHNQQSKNFAAFSLFSCALLLCLLISMSRFSSCSLKLSSFASSTLSYKLRSDMKQSWPSLKLIPWSNFFPFSFHDFVFFALSPNFYVSFFSTVPHCWFYKILVILLHFLCAFRWLAFHCTPISSNPKISFVSFSLSLYIDDFVFLCTLDLASSCA